MTMISNLSENTMQAEQKARLGTWSPQKAVELMLGRNMWQPRKQDRYPGQADHNSKHEPQTGQKTRMNTHKHDLVPYVPIHRHI